MSEKVSFLVGKKFTAKKKIIIMFATKLNTFCEENVDVHVRAVHKIFRVFKTLNDKK